MYAIISARMVPSHTMKLVIAPYENINDNKKEDHNLRGLAGAFSNRIYFIDDGGHGVRLAT